MRSRVLANVHAMDISGREEEEMLLAADNGIEILVMILMERGLRKMVANPEVDGFREATQGLRGPGYVGLAVSS